MALFPSKQRLSSRLSRKLLVSWAFYRVVSLQPTLALRWCWVSGLRPTLSCQPTMAPPPGTWDDIKHVTSIRHLITRTLCERGAKPGVWCSAGTSGRLCCGLPSGRRGGSSFRLLRTLPPPWAAGQRDSESSKNQTLQTFTSDIIFTSHTAQVSMFISTVTAAGSTHQPLRPSRGL